MKTLGIVVVILLAFGMIYAQSPAGSSLTVSSNASCSTPAVGVFAICKPSAGGTAQWTDEGSPYVKVNLAGIAGPAGPQGPTGLTGPQGPAGTLPTSFTCDFVLAAGGKATLSNCK